jgi:hypothetical protein
MTKPKVVTHPLTTEVEIAIAKADLLRDRRLLVDLKRRRLGLAQDAKVANGHLDLASRDLRIERIRRPPLD